ncbi:hypothetical protein E2562_038382 [Oryza meyeriana var. granulata]|uniref:Uncharacterized protein n=1 Tax=Oryza meyeriana var. granulata TaxID=110450 RepID=A0A6G1CXP3_9ORYZ|nr:hypothetical protein E2562_038382 [Oryza meyeriana var. granulata]
MVVAASTSREVTDTAASMLVQGLMEHGLTAELGLKGGSIGDVCSPACHTNLIVCAIKCVLKPCSKKREKMRS